MIWRLVVLCVESRCWLVILVRLLGKLFWGSYHACDVHCARTASFRGHPELSLRSDVIGCWINTRESIKILVLHFPWLFIVVRGAKSCVDLVLQIFRHITSWSCDCCSGCEHSTPIGTVPVVFEVGSTGCYGLSKPTLLHIITFKHVLHLLWYMVPIGLPGTSLTFQ